MGYCGMQWVYLVYSREQTMKTKKDAIKRLFLNEIFFIFFMALGCLMVPVYDRWRV